MRPILRFSGRRVTPVVRQTEAAECGLACLAMVAAHHGHHIDLATLRQSQPASGRGVNIGQLAIAATRIGLNARPIKAELADLPQLTLPAILHWDFAHFVVLTAVRRGQAVIHDPALGRRTLPLTELSRHFTGICLELRPGIEFSPRAAAPRISVLDLLGRLRDCRGALAQVLLMAAALEVFAVAAPLFVQLVVDQAVVSADRGLLTVLGLGFGLLALVQTGVTAARAWVVMVLSTALNMQLLTGLFAHLLKLPLAYFERRHLGDIGSRFESLGTIQRTLTTSFVETLLDGAMAGVTVVVMGLYAPRLALIVLVAALLYGGVRAALYRASRSAQDEQISHMALQHSSFLETVRGIQSVKLFSREQQRSTRYAHLLADNLNAGIRLQRLTIASQAAQGVIFGVENIAVVWLGASLVLDGALSVGMLFAFVAFKQQFAARTAAFVDRAVEFGMLGLHAERVGDIALAAPERGHGQQDTPLADAAVELRNVSFRYSAFDAPVIERLNLRIEAGESVAITGPSGCGKTTLLKLMLGLLEPTEGEVLIGGVNIASAGLAYREAMGAVMQDDDLFAGTIADNICFFDLERDQARIEACARAAAIDADIDAMPMRYHTRVGDMGAALSGGQKQRLLLARALYKQPRILVLDEATSHLDTGCERNVNEAVRALALTRIIVAHRAETIATAGRVIVLGEAQGGETVRRLVAAA
ncbi:MAG: peptidase domain-containing ABC transporter [Burkholderiales bacterium]|nr:peptidase domain-containing ABC transporter [Burkholderiales bacterium]